jgi:hypothetical protein
MKKVILFALFMPVMVYGQIIENFESGQIRNWTESSAGHWKADNEGPISGSFSLHHIFDNPATGSDCIGLPLNDLHPSEGSVKWSFTLRHGYDPSSTNNWAVFLMSDSDPLSYSGTSSLSGYAVGINLTGYDDTLRLWKIRNGKISVVLTCPVNWQNNIGTVNHAHISVERNIEGRWNTVIRDHLYVPVGSAVATDTELFNNSWFLVNYRYSSTRDRLLWFDDLVIEGIFYKDTSAPSVRDFIVSGRNSLALTFSEELEGDTLIPEDLLLNGSVNAVTVNKITDLKYNIGFQFPFKNKMENNLVIRSLCDKAGNCGEDVRLAFIPVWADPGDIIISEVMADPLPQVSLPPKEYIELFNRSDYRLNLKKWNLFFNEEKVILPEFFIEPGKQVILCSVSDTGLFRFYGETRGIKPFPALTDEGKQLVLKDSLGNLVHGIEYSSSWYGSNLKSDGGWSLEIIDPDFPFYAEGNWEVSSSGRGGTPGKPNSARRFNPDTFFSGIENVFPSDSLNINIRFSEPLVNYSEIADHLTIGDIHTTSFLPSDHLLRSFRITTSVPLEKGKLYSLYSGQGLKDFAGNQAERVSSLFGIPEPAGNGDVLFNELLFNPLPGDPDFIELFNRSEKIIDASRLSLASVSDEGVFSGKKPLSEMGRCLLPGYYYALTSDRTKIIERYFGGQSENIYKAGSLPSMPDAKGHLLLFNNSLEIIDEVIYNEKMHHPLLTEKDGISLEKIRPELSSLDPSVWHSATESSGWGTPGAPNSINVQFPPASDIISLSGRRISPDNDGFEDVLVIDFSLTGTGNILSLTVFDERGGLIRKIAQNLFAGTGASLVWDGTAADGSLVESGIYIILVQLYDEKGKTHSWKKVCAVVR